MIRSIASLLVLLAVAGMGGPKSNVTTSIAAVAVAKPPPSAVPVTPPIDDVPAEWRDRFVRARLLPVLSPELVEDCLAVAADIDPDLAGRLRELRKSNPEDFRRKLQRSRRLVSLAELRRRDAVAYDLKLTELRTDARVSRLSADVREARRDGRSSEAAALERELRMQVIIQLGFQYKAREDYVCRLRELVHELEQELEYDRTHFNELMEQRMAELLRETDGALDARPVSASPRD